MNQVDATGILLLTVSLLLLGVWMVGIFYKFSYISAAYWRRRIILHSVLIVAYGFYAPCTVLFAMLSGGWAWYINFVIYGSICVFHVFLRRDAVRRWEILSGEKYVNPYHITRKARA